MLRPSETCERWPSCTEYLEAGRKAWTFRHCPVCELPAWPAFYQPVTRLPTIFLQNTRCSLSALATVAFRAVEAGSGFSCGPYSSDFEKSWQLGRLWSCSKSGLRKASRALSSMLGRCPCLPNLQLGVARYEKLASSELARICAQRLPCAADMLDLKSCLLISCTSCASSIHTFWSSNFPGTVVHQALGCLDNSLSHSNIISEVFLQ